MDIRKPDGFNILALCAGGGGLELGIELALPSARTVCVVEREGFACEILASAHERLGLGAPVGWTDLRTFDGRPWRGVVDCVAAGIPCQPHSTAGKRLGARDERNLWPDTARVIRECGAPFIFLENVGGAVAFFGEHVINGLEAMGYRVEAGLFSAEEIGASHGRERLFVLAYAPRLCESGQGREDRRGGRGTERAGASVADAGCSERRKAAVGKNSPARETVTGVERTGAELADAERPGLEGAKPAGRGRADGRPSEHGGELPLFPPGPGDLEAWRAVLARDPSLEPAIRGVADGLASRVDRLRLLGNGVVPLQAAYAFCTLLARLEHGMSGKG